MNLNKNIVNIIIDKVCNMRWKNNMRKLNEEYKNLYIMKDNNLYNYDYLCKYYNKDHNKDHTSHIYVYFNYRCLEINLTKLLGGSILNNNKYSGYMLPKYYQYSSGLRNTFGYN